MQVFGGLGFAEQAEWRRLYLAADQGNLAANDIILLSDTGEGSGISWIGNKGILTAGKSYELMAAGRNWGNNTNDAVYLRWWDVTNAGWLGTGTLTAAFSSSSDDGSQPVALATITPSTDIEVELRVSGIGGTVPGILADSCWGMIKQISKQVFTGSLTGDIAINDQAASGYFDIGTMRMQWGRVASTSDDDQLVTFPVPFSAIPMVSAQTEITTGTAAGWGAATNDVTTTNFKFNRDDTITNATHNPYIAWVAIGLKP